ncbi:MAG: hypothetical protein WCV86_01945 [Patescibacteria group bacterium]|jgi:hypothetical protein
MPNVGVEAFTQHEGQGMELFSVADAWKLKMVPGDANELGIIEAALKKI